MIASRYGRAASEPPSRPARTSAGLPGSQMPAPDHAVVPPTNFDFSITSVRRPRAAAAYAPNSPPPDPTTITSKCSLRAVVSLTVTGIPSRASPAPVVPVRLEGGDRLAPRLDEGHPIGAGGHHERRAGVDDEELTGTNRAEVERRVAVVATFVLIEELDVDRATEDDRELVVIEVV